MSRAYGPEEAKKLGQIIAEGANVLREVEDLKLGLKDTVKAIAEELSIKPALINKAISIVHKGNWGDLEEDYAELEAILTITKKID